VLLIIHEHAACLIFCPVYICRYVLKNCDLDVLNKSRTLDNKKTGGITLKINQIAGIALLVVGIILLYFGYQSSQALGEQIHETFTGRFSDATTWYFILGAASTVVGAALFFLKR